MALKLNISNQPLKMYPECAHLEIHCVPTSIQVGVINNRSFALVQLHIIVCQVFNYGHTLPSGYLTTIQLYRIQYNVAKCGVQLN